MSRKYLANIIRPGIQRPIETVRCGDDWLMVFEAREFDLTRMARIERETWNPAQAASAETIRRRFELNPRCALVVCSLKQGGPVGFIAMLPLSELHIPEFKPWSFYADLAVDPRHFSRLNQIKCQYAISITVHPEAPRGAGTVLVSAAAKWCAAQGVPHLMYGIRVPTYDRLSRERGLSFDAYFDGLLKHELHEDIFKVATNSDGKAIGYMPGYYDDPESKNYGVIMLHDTGVAGA